MVQGQEQIFLKSGEGGGGGWHYSYLIFSRFIIFTLPFAKLCYASEEKKFFSATIILWKRVIQSYLKMNMKFRI